METQTTVVLSTAHLSRRDAEVMEQHSDKIECARVMRDEYGFFVNLIPEMTATQAAEERYPSLAKCTKWAGDRGFGSILFDCDGPTVEDLPAFDW